MYHGDKMAIIIALRKKHAQAHLTQSEKKWLKEGRRDPLQISFDYDFLGYKKTF